MEDGINCSVLNVSIGDLEICPFNQSDERVHTAHLSKSISLLCFPPLLLICIVGNVFNIIVFSQYRAINIREILLITLSFSDIMLMSFHLPRQIADWSNHFMSYPLETNHPYFLYFQAGSTWIQHASYYFSDWILVILSCERLSMVLMPLIHRDWKWQLTKAKLLMIYIFPVCLLIPLGTTVHFYHWLTTEDSQIHYSSPPWLNKWIVLQSKIDIILPLLTSFILLGLNITLLRLIKHTHTRSMSLQAGSILMKSRSLKSQPSQPTTSEAVTSGSRAIVKRGTRFPRLGETFSDNRENDHSRPAQERKRTIIILSSVCVYFLTQFPAVIFNTAYDLSLYPICLFHFSSASLFQPLVMTMTWINYSITGPVYTLVDTDYRRRLKALISRNCCVDLRRTDSGGFARVPLFSSSSMRSTSTWWSSIRSTSLSHWQSLRSASLRSSSGGGGAGNGVESTAKLQEKIALHANNNGVTSMILEETSVQSQLSHSDKDDEVFV